jgi:hypothetical protein
VDKQLFVGCHFASEPGSPSFGEIINKQPICKGCSKKKVHNRLECMNRLATSPDPKERQRCKDQVKRCLDFQVQPAVGENKKLKPSTLSHRFFIFAKLPSQSTLSWTFFQKEECPKKMVSVGSFRDASSSSVCRVQIIPQLHAALGQSTVQAFEVSKLSPCCSPLRREATNGKAALQRKSFIGVGHHQRAFRCQRNSL